MKKIKISLIMLAFSSQLIIPIVGVTSEQKFDETEPSILKHLNNSELINQISTSTVESDINDWMPDKNLQQIISSELNMPVHEITKNDMKNLKKVDLTSLPENTSVNLSGLEYINELEFLDTTSIIATSIPNITMASNAVLFTRPNVLEYIIPKGPVSSLHIGNYNNCLSTDELQNVGQHLSGWIISMLAIYTQNMTDFSMLNLQESILQNADVSIMTKEKIVLKDLVVKDHEVNTIYSDPISKDVLGNPMPSSLSNSTASVGIGGKNQLGNDFSLTEGVDFQLTDEGISFNNIPTDADFLEIQFFVPNKLMVDKFDSTNSIRYGAQYIIPIRYIFSGKDVIVKYVDETGVTLLPNIILSGNMNETYTTEEKKIPGYTFKEVAGNSNGLFTDEVQTVTYIYTKVKKDKQTINGSDFTMYVGDKEPTVDSFKASATDEDGNPIDVTADLSKVDFSKAGIYNVILSSEDGQTKAVKLTIKENKQSITGSNFTMYVGDKKPTVDSFKASATDKDGNLIDVTADSSKVDFSKAGTYDVILTATDGQTKTVKLFIKDKIIKPSIDATNKTRYVGDKLTKEEILNWATFKNADGFVQGFEVVGTPIPVSLEDKLTTKGSYKINYYVQKKAEESSPILAQKEIILTVSEQKSSPINTKKPLQSITSGTNQIPISKITIAPTKSNDYSGTTVGKSLPKTGEHNSPIWYVAGVALLAIVGGLFMWTKKNKKE